MQQVSMTQCNVAIWTPQGTQLIFGSAPQRDQVLAQTWSTRDGSVLAVETDKDLTQACGGFRITLDGRHDTAGRHWDQRIPMRSLVFIRFEREGAPEIPQTEPTVMIGLTDTHSIQESYSEAGPRRLVTIRGRELSCVILDAMLVYHPLLAANPAYGTITITGQTRAPLTLALVADPLLVSKGDPIDILRIILDRYLFVGGPAPAASSPTAPPVPAPAEAGGVQSSANSTAVPQHPLISLDLPNLALSQLLDPNYASWKTFEPVRLAAPPQFPAQVGSLWNYLHIYIDRVFQEFFTRIEDGKCKIHFRGKPFLHTQVTSGTRFKSTDKEPTLQTIPLDPADILAMQVHRDTTNVYNYFLVVPRGLTDLHTGPFWTNQVLPQVVKEHDHPSFVGRYGIRMLRVESPYLDPLASLPSSPATSPPPPRGLKAPPPGASIWADKANAYAAQEGVPPAQRPWFVALIRQESYFNPNADVASKNGSRDQGIAQFNTVTGPTNVGLINPFDPDNALPAAARYWVQLSTQVGNDPRLIAAAYNVGPGAVIAAKGVPASATQHVAAVTSFVPEYQKYAGTTTPVPASPAPAPPPQAAPSAGQMQLVETAQHWGRILKAWHDMGGELFGGFLTVRGHPIYNIGHRLLCRDHQGEWEAYIEGCSHRYDARTGQYVTHLRITRGWYLSEAIYKQRQEEGQTTITSSRGGPPSVDPGQEPGQGQSR
jgi:Transglycosylase SLT domain